ncbi:SAM-dependent methyltransferase [Streptomyces sp. NPDC004783]|uniref:SAM-dependent methyltransferase n=1 Tax=Streptomyces sp. NPDC004783 TaxID=3154459 RepID=UPI0033B79E6C
MGWDAPSAASVETRSLHDDFATTPGPAHQQICTSVPHSARIWNHWLGGKDNRPVDERAGDACAESGAAPYVLRTVDEIASFFDGPELVDPGVVPVPLWRPDTLSPAPEAIG